MPTTSTTGLTTREERLCAAIAARRTALYEELATHVAIPTGTGHAVGIQEYRGLLLERLAALGAVVEMVPGADRPQWLELPRFRHAAEGRGAEEDEDEGDDLGAPSTALATRTVDGVAPSILIAGHVDTVHDPYGAFRHLERSSDGVTAVGPGAADMKGGILIALTALEALAENGIDLPWTVLLNADEEMGSFHSATALREAASRHRIGLALEPAMPDGSLVVGRMGTGQFRITVKGRAAHVGRDFARGVSAVHAMAHVITRLESMIDLERGAIVNVGPLVGGPVTNAVADHAACWGNVRFADESIQRELDDRFAALATAAPDESDSSDAAQDAPLPRVIVEKAFNRPAKPMTPAVESLALAARGVAEDLGQRLPFATTGGVCDGNILQAAGLPTIDTLGVRGGNLHRTDEFIEIASLVERAQLFAVLMARLGEE